MLGLLVYILLYELLLLVFIYISDKTLKLVSQFDIKQIKFVELIKWKYFFVYHKRNDGVIAKKSFVYSIANYIINGMLIILFIIHIENESYFIKFFGVFVALNLGLFLVVASQPILNSEQRKMWEEQKIKLVVEASNRELAEKAQRKEEKKRRKK